MESLQPHEIKSISNWFITNVVKWLETLDSQNGIQIPEDYHGPILWKQQQHSLRPGVYHALLEFIRWQLTYLNDKKIEDLSFLDELINKLGDKLWTEHYGVLLEEELLIFRDKHYYGNYNCTDFHRTLIEKKRDKLDSSVYDLFNIIIIGSLSFKIDNFSERIKFYLENANTFKTQLVADRMCMLLIDKIKAQINCARTYYDRALSAFGAVRLMSTIESPEVRNSKMVDFFEEFRDAPDLKSFIFLAICSALIFADRSNVNKT